MKEILVVDVPVLEDGRHLCNECPIWNKEHLFCEYDHNMETKGCPLNPMPKRMLEVARMRNGNIVNVQETSFANGWNACLEEIEG